MGLQANLLNFAFMLTSNRDDAYDLLQDTTLKALDNADKYVENTNFKGWVFTIMRNIFINNYRRVVRSATVIDQTDDLYHLNLSQDSGLETPEGSFGAKEITDAINEFPDKYRIPLFDARGWLQVRRDRRKDAVAAGHHQEPHILRAPTAPDTLRRLPLSRRVDADK